MPVYIWESVEEGSPLTVEYIKGEPDAVRMAGDSSEETIASIVVLSAGGPPYHSGPVNGLAKPRHLLSIGSPHEYF